MLNRTRWARLCAFTGRVVLVVDRGPGRETSPQIFLGNHLLGQSTTCRVLHWRAPNAAVRWSSWRVDIAVDIAASDRIYLYALLLYPDKKTELLNVSVLCPMMMAAAWSSTRNRAKKRPALTSGPSFIKCLFHRVSWGKEPACTLLSSLVNRSSFPRFLGLLVPRYPSQPDPLLRSSLGRSVAWRGEYPVVRVISVCCQAAFFLLCGDGVLRNRVPFCDCLFHSRRAFALHSSGQVSPTVTHRSSITPPPREGTPSPLLPATLG